MRLHRYWKSLVSTLLVVILLTATSAQAQETTLSLLTYNIHSEIELLDPMIALIRAADADIVALQEVRPESYAYFQTEFAMDYATIIGPAADERWRPLLLLSRYPVLTHEYYGPSAVRMLRAVVDLGDQQITILNAYPVNPTGNEGYDSDERSRQIGFLLDLAAQESNPVIMLGDFNTEEWSDDYEALTVDYIDAFRSLHPEALGATFPDYSTPQSRVNMHFPRWTPPILRIDYVFHDPSFSPLEARVWPESGGSDHRPLFVQVSLPNIE